MITILKHLTGWRLPAATSVALVTWIWTVSQGQAGHHGAATMFEPGLVSTGREYSISFSPDGEVAYFTRGNDIYWMQQSDSGWSQPVRASFSSGAWIEGYLADGVAPVYFNWDPVFSPDGKRLFIMSHGLVGGKIVGGEEADIDLWVLDRIGEGYTGDVWSEPKNMGPAINSPDHNEGALGISREGTVYFFSSGRDDTLGRADIYVSALEGGRYQPAVNMGAPINSDGWDGHVYADPDGAFIIYLTYGERAPYGSCDLVVSHRTATGWSAPLNLGPNVNTEHCELTPSLSPDGETLYFGRDTGEGAEEIRNIFTIKLRDTAFAKSLPIMAAGVPGSSATEREHP